MSYFSRRCQYSHITVRIRDAINKPLLKFVTGPYCVFVSLRTSSRLLGVLQSRRAFLRFRFVTHDRREKTPNGVRRVNSRGEGVGRGGRLAFLAERTERAMKYDSAILRRQPPLDVTLRYLEASAAT